MRCSTPPAARPGCRSITAAESASATRSTPASSSCATAPPPPPAASSACCGTIRRAGSCGMRTPATRARSSVPARSTSTCRSCKAERQERMSEPLKLWRNAQLATCDAAARVIARGALTTRAARIEWVGEEAALPAAADEVHDLAGAWVTPGLIDCHTHLVFAGTRANEYAERLRGRSYEEIARAGGGILATVRAVRAASEEQLFDESAPRLAALLAEGVTTVEIKSGYGLTLADEAKMLRVARHLGRAFPVTVRTTLLAAHTLPPEYRGRADEYIEAIAREWLPQLCAPAAGCGAARAPGGARRRERLQSRLRPRRVASHRDEHGDAAVRPDGGGSAAGRHAPCGARARARGRARRARRRAGSRLRGVEPALHRGARVLDWL